MKRKDEIEYKKITVCVCVCVHTQKPKLQGELLGIWNKTESILEISEMLTITVVSHWITCCPQVNVRWFLA